MQQQQNKKKRRKEQLKWNRSIVYCAILSFYSCESLAIAIEQSLKEISDSCVLGWSLYCHLSNGDLKHGSERKCKILRIVLSDLMSDSWIILTPISFDVTEEEKKVSVEMWNELFWNWFPGRNWVI